MKFLLSMSFNICFGCSKELSHLDVFIEYPQHMLGRLILSLLFWICYKRSLCGCSTILLYKLKIELFALNILCFFHFDFFVIFPNTRNNLLWNKTNIKWSWKNSKSKYDSGKATITHCIPIHGTMRKIHRTLTVTRHLRSTVAQS